MLNILTEEADVSIKNAYEKGYKEGVLEFKPEVEYWKTMYKECEKLSYSDNLKYGAIGTVVGLSLGAFATLIVSVK